MQEQQEIIPPNNDGELEPKKNDIVPKKDSKPVKKEENSITQYLKEHKELTIGLIAGGIIGGLIVFFAVFVCISVGSLLVGYFLRLYLERRNQGENTNAEINHG